MKFKRLLTVLMALCMIASLTMFAFADGEAAAAETQEGGFLGGTTGMLIPMVALVAIFYFLMIRPENKKKKQAEEMRKNVKVGDSITTIGGVVGEVCHVKDDIVVIEVGADRVRLEFNKWAISTNNTAQKDAEKAREAAAAKRKEEKENKKKK